jgi:hypothetical protein
LAAQLLARLVALYLVARLTAATVVIPWPPEETKYHRMMAKQ